MSLFDTIVFPEAITCARCGASVTSTQTYADDPLKSIVQAFRERLGRSGEADGLSS